MIKIPNKWELQKIAFNHSSNICFKALIDILQKYTAKPYSFLVTYTTLASDNPLRLKKNIREKNIKTNHDNWW